MAVVLAVGLATTGSVPVPRAPAFGRSAGPPDAVVVQGRASPELPAERTRQVEALLAGRTRAVLTRDRAAFLAGVDPQATGFAARQAALFDALAQVPLSAWTYTLHTDRTQPPDPALDARYGTWWAPRVVHGVALDGVDDNPAESDQALTFVRRQGRWYLAADDDFVTRGALTARAVWDDGPVSVVSGVRTLVIGHPGSLPQMRRLAHEVDEAVLRATAAWGPQWPQRVAVVVPADATELARLVPAGVDLAPLAALDVAGPVRGGTGLGADRVFVHPVNLARLGDVGRGVVLRHEVTHVAARSATGALTPTWLSEGLADHVGFLGTGLPVADAAGELRDEVQAGRLPTALPAAADFDGAGAQLSAIYEQAWLAVELLCRTYGQDRVLALYRDLGARQGDDPAGALDAALRAQLGLSTAGLTRSWRAFLLQELAPAPTGMPLAAALEPPS